MRLPPFSRFIVVDNSMIPAYFPGDCVLTFNWIVPKKGDVVVFADGSVTYLKRISKIRKKTFLLKGDNNRYSLKVYKVLFNSIVGKVFLKY